MNIKLTRINFIQHFNTFHNIDDKITVVYKEDDILIIQKFSAKQFNKALFRYTDQTFIESDVPLEIMNMIKSKEKKNDNNVCTYTTATNDICCIVIHGDL